MIFANTKEWLQDYGIEVYHLGTTVEQIKKVLGNLSAVHTTVIM